MKSKMLHASSMRPLVASLQEGSNLAFTRSIELEPDECNESELRKQLYVYE